MARKMCQWAAILLSGGKMKPGVTMSRTLFMSSVVQQKIGLARLNQLMMTCTRSALPPDSEIHATLSTLETLERHGCPLYQVMEYPPIVFMSTRRITEHVQLLHTCGVYHVSVPMIKIAVKCAEQGADVKDACDEYLDSLRGHASLSDYLASRLQCTETETLLMVEQNPTFFGRIQLHHIRHVVDKVELVVTGGIDLSDFKTKLYMVSERSVPVLSDRVRLLARLGLNKNFPVRALGLSEEELVARVKQMKQPQSVWKTLTNSLGLTEEEAKALFHWVKLPATVAVLQERLDILQRVGFRPAEIIKWSVLLSFPAKRLNKVHERMLQYDMDAANIAEFTQICHRGHTLALGKIARAQSVKTVLKKALSCMPPSVTVLPDAALDALHALGYDGLHANCTMLRDFGFSDKDIAACVLCLAYPPSQLQQHLQQLPVYASSVMDEELSKKQLLKLNRKQMLNILSFYIEKENNFACF